MKNTVESSIQAIVEKTQERQANSTPPPTLPVTTHLPTISHPPLTSEHPPPQPPSSRRSRSHRHRSSSRRHDKRPISVHRSPRRRRSHRRPRQSSRPRSTSRDEPARRKDSRRRDRARSITLRSASPQHREVRHKNEEQHQPPDYSSTKPTLQAAPWWTSQQTTTFTDHQDRTYYQEKSSNDKWQSWGQWKDYSKHLASSHQSNWVDYTQPSSHHGTPQEYSTKPITAFSSTHPAPPRHKRSKPAPSGDDRSTASVNVPSGHMLINLQEGSKEEWIRGVKFALRHPERMPSVSEVPLDMKPRPNKTVEIAEFQSAVASLQKVDPRIPPEITKKAVQLLFSTNLLPGFDLEKPYVLRH